MYKYINKVKKLVRKLSKELRVQNLKFWHWCLWRCAYLECYTVWI